MNKNKNNNHNLNKKTISIWMNVIVFVVANKGFYYPSELVFNRDYFNSY